MFVNGGTYERCNVVGEDGGVCGTLAYQNLNVFRFVIFLWCFFEHFFIPSYSCGVSACNCTALHLSRSYEQIYLILAHVIFCIVLLFFDEYI